RAAPATILSLQTLGDELAHVLDRQRLLGLLHFSPEVHHGQAERTGGADDVRARRQQLLDADDVHALLGFHFHPHVPAAAATAQATLAGPRRIDAAEPRHGVGDVARRIHDSVVAAEVTRIVKDDGGVERLLRLDPPTRDQLLDQDRVVNDLVGPAELRELVLDR